MLIDGHGRKHDYLRISLTEKCNLRCMYCMPANGIDLLPQAHLMQREEILFIAKSFVQKGVKKIRLTGGEPLVRKDFASILSDLSQLGVELTLTSNGILIDRFIDDLKKAKVKSVNISLDTLKEKRQQQITRRDYFQKILNNIQLLINDGIHVKINTVMMKNVNDDELIDFIAFTKNQPVDWRFIEFMPFNGNDWEWDKGIPYLNLLEKAQLHFGEQNIQKVPNGPNDTTKHYQVKGYQGRFGFISTVSEPFCDTCNRLRLTADGKMKNCLFSNGEADLLGALRKGEDIMPLVEVNLKMKKAIRSGMTSFDAFADESNNQKNRAMIAIGG